MALVNGLQASGANVSGATTAGLTIAGAQLTDAGVYTVTVSTTLDAYNAAGTALVANTLPVSATSSGAKLTVNAAPVIGTAPVSQSVSVGDAVTLSVVATGTPPLSYQWSKGASAISGATNASYVIASAQPTDAGSYSVTVTNGLGSATGGPATLTVNQTFAAWAAAAGLTGTNATATATPAHDGVANLDKYALGLPALTPVVSGLPALTRESSQWIFRYTLANWTTGITATVQTSTDLVTWTDFATTPVVESSTATTQTFKAVLTGGTKLFARLNVTQQ